MNMTRVILCCLLIIILWATHAAGNTWYILPDGTGDAPNIQAAIDAGSPGDTLLLGPGTFADNDTIASLHSLTFTSVAGAEQTIIKCRQMMFGDWSDYNILIAFSGITILFDHMAMRSINTRIEDCIIGPSGQVRCDEHSTAIARRTLFRDASLGVAMGTLDVSDCRFEGPGAYTGGGETMVTVSRCVFVGGIYGVECGLARSHIVDCEFSGVQWYAIASEGEPIIDNCYFHDNPGIVIYVDFGDATITRCVFTHNTGPLFRAFGCPTVFTGNTIVGNVPTQGAFVSSMFTDVTFRENIIAFNNAATFFEVEGGTPVMTLTDNDLFANQWGDLGPITDGGGNFSADPWFCNPFQDDYTLQQGSPCLADNSPTGTLVGALGVGCDATTGTLKLRPRATNTQAWDAITAVLAMDGADTIDPSTVRLNGLVPPLLDEVATTQPAKRGEGGPILPVRPGDRLVLNFDLDELMATFATDDSEQRVTFTAQRGDGTPVRTGTTMRLVGLPGSEADPEREAETQRVVDGINSVTPNPFNPVTRIRYGVTAPGRVTLVVYDVAGRQVSTLVDTDMPAGTHQATWSADNTASGIYFARLTTPQGTWTRKLVVVK